MKAPPFFIIIPSTNKATYYIKPQDVSHLVELTDGSVTVAYKAGEDIFYFDTLLTAQEIHERILELEEANFKFTWGEPDASN